MDGTNSKWLLNPLDRAAEILFGLIMALTFTCTISITTHDTRITQLLYGALGCNVAWGVVDATMYLIGVLANKSRTKMMLDALQDPSKTEDARKYIAERLPSSLSSRLDHHELEEIRIKLASFSQIAARVRVTKEDLAKAAALFLLIVISTLPIVLPFLFIGDTKIALRVSNAIAILMMFMCGWSVAGYVGYKKWKMSIAMVLLGIFMVGITVALGG